MPTPRNTGVIVSAQEILDGVNAWFSQPRTHPRYDNIGVDWAPDPDSVTCRMKTDPRGTILDFMPRFTPNKSVQELRASLGQMGIVTCSCAGFTDDDGVRKVIVDPTCAVHTDRCFACGKIR